MQNKKLIRGKPVYLYRGEYVDSIPDGCRIKSVVYDEVSNKSLIYCKRKSNLFEVIVLVLILVCVIVNIIIVPNMNYSIRYNSVASYYNGKLYVNIYNEPDNDITIRVYSTYDGETIFDAKVDAGQYLYTMEVPYYDSYDIYVEYPILWFSKVDAFKISAYNMDANNPY